MFTEYSIKIQKRSLYVQCMFILYSMCSESVLFLLICSLNFFEFIDCSLNKWSLKKSLCSLFVKIFEQLCSSAREIFLHADFFLRALFDLRAKIRQFSEGQHVNFFCTQIEKCTWKKITCRKYSCALKISTACKNIKNSLL